VIRVAALEARPLDVPMREPFEIATGVETSVRNVLVRVKLSDGTVGWGEGAPMAAFDGQTQEKTLASLGSLRLEGRPAGDWRPVLEELESLPGAGRAAAQTAFLDAWCRRARLPLRALFGGAETSVRSDVTVAIVPAHEAARQAARIRAMGVGTIKIKVGKDVDDDEERVRAIEKAAPKTRLLLDANQGYGPKGSLELLRRLKKSGIKPALFEQPADKDDWDGLARVERLGGVPVAADETVSSRADAVKMARVRAASVVNIKLMKCGLLEAWDIALILRGAGLKLMVGGMIESSLAMTAAAHLAAGLGGFSFVDLDTPLWFASDPMKGVSIGRGGVYDLSKVKAGVGVFPK
jgi:L-alanine-DL-glutamate epimerase-like enolase superfamily enzyme